MFEIANERKQFWQWDMGQRLIVGDDVCSEVHFCNGTDECSLVCGVYEEEGQRFVDVPNILFQTAKIIKVFAYIRDADERYTEYRQAFVVLPRTRPADYVYTETETLSYATLEKRIAELEENGAGVNEEEVRGIVADYMEENPVETDTTLTESDKAADAKAVGEKFTEQSKAIDDLKESGVGGSGLTTNEKTLMLSLFEHALYNADVSQIVTALKNAWSDGTGDDGGTDEPEAVLYIITNNLTNVTNSNEAVSAKANTSYTATLTANVGDIHSVSVVMGGVDVTADVYVDGIITIPAVVGNIAITASATQYVNLLDGAEWRKGTAEDVNNGLTYNVNSGVEFTFSEGTYYFYELYNTAAGGVPGFYVPNGDGTYTGLVNNTDFIGEDNNGLFKDGGYNEYGKETSSKYQPNGEGYLVQTTVTFQQTVTVRIIMPSTARTITEPGYTWCFTQPYNPHKDTLGWEVE